MQTYGWIPTFSIMCISSSFPPQNSWLNLKMFCLSTFSYNQIFHIFASYLNNWGNLKSIDMKRKFNNIALDSFSILLDVILIPYCPNMPETLQTRFVRCLSISNFLSDVKFTMAHIGVYWNVNVSGRLKVFVFKHPACLCYFVWEEVNTFPQNMDISRALDPETAKMDTFTVAAWLEAPNKETGNLVVIRPTLVFGLKINIKHRVNCIWNNQNTCAWNIVRFRVMSYFRQCSAMFCLTCAWFMITYMI